MESNRREFLKGSMLGAVGAALSGFRPAAAADSPHDDELTAVAALPEGVTRPWLGPAYWGNRLQDWRLNEGRIECLRGEESFEVRTVGVLTREMVEGDEPGHLSVETGLLEGADLGGFSGFLVGVGGGELDYRAAALAQRGSGEGGGFMVTFATDGRARFREHTDKHHPLAFAELPAEKQVADGGALQPAPDQRIRLRLDLLPQGSGRFDVRFRAFDAATDRFLAGATRRGVPEEELLGGILLVSSPPTGQAGARWWFRDLRTGGAKVAEHPERALGPILGAMHTLNRDVVKLSAQLMPVADDEPQTVTLEYRPAGSGGSWRSAEADLQTGYTALFRVEDWDAGRDWDYRVRYDGADGEATYEGRIRRDPVDADELKIGLFSCVLAAANPLEGDVYEPELPQARWIGRFTHENIYHPHEELVRNASYHEPHLNVFAGDQFYEHTPTRLPGRVNPFYDYLYKWYLWVWAFRDMTRETPAVLLIDDHDVYHPNVWGEGGEQAPLELSTPWNYGGYVGRAEFVNMVQRTQCSHNPDPYDPTPVKRGITVYYGAFNYGGVGFAVLEDRKFKTAPLHGEDLNVHEPELLGDRQEAFLEAWGRDGDGPKICLTQTCFASLQTSPNGRPLIDFDSNGYPKISRDRAVELLREANALVLAGDQHLASLVRHGLDDYTDGPLQFSGPAGGSFWQRWFEPAEELPNSTDRRNTGDWKDAFGNKMRVLAVANPKITFAEYREHIQRRTQSVEDRRLKSEGYGLVRVDRDDETYVLECWPWDEDPSAPGAAQFDGWSYRVSFAEAGRAEKG